MMILCKVCYEAKEGTDWYPSTMGRAACDECGQVADECFEVEEADEVEL